MLLKKCTTTNNWVYYIYIYKYVYIYVCTNNSVHIKKRVLIKKTHTNSKQKPTVCPTLTSSDKVATLNVKKQYPNATVWQCTECQQSSAVFVQLQALKLATLGTEERGYSVLRLSQAAHCRVKPFTQWSKTWVSSWILTSSQPHRVNPLPSYYGQ